MLTFAPHILVHHTLWEWTALCSVQDGRLGRRAGCLHRFNTRAPPPKGCAHQLKRYPNFLGLLETLHGNRKICIGGETKGESPSDASLLSRGSRAAPALRVSAASFYGGS